jgi:ribosomal protein S18 acetylase RimI-like enzyme
MKKGFYMKKRNIHLFIVVFVTCMLNADNIVLYQDNHRVSLLSILKRYPEDLCIMGAGKSSQPEETASLLNSDKCVTKVYINEDEPVGFVNYTKEVYLAPFIENPFSFNQSKPIQSKRHGVIHLLGVSEENQRQGIGRTLVLEALKAMEDKGVEVVFVATAANNTAARSLYEKCGFSLHMPVSPGAPAAVYRLIVNRGASSHSS